VHHTQIRAQFAPLIVTWSGKPRDHDAGALRLSCVPFARGVRRCEHRSGCHCRAMQLCRLRISMHAATITLTAQAIGQRFPQSGVLSSVVQKGPPVFNR